MREITLRVRSRNHSSTVQIWAELVDGPRGLVLGRGHESATWSRGPGEDFTDQELWELIIALRNEIQAWQAKLPLDY